MSERARATAPRCPFCDEAIARPQVLDPGDADEVQGGTCSCGAIYLADPTGKNVGLVMARALTMAADLLRKNVTDLDPDSDYEDAVLSYDWRNHRSIGEVKGFMDGYGRLYVVRVKRGGS